MAAFRALAFPLLSAVAVASSGEADFDAVSLLQLPLPEGPGQSQLVGAMAGVPDGLLAVMASSGLMAQLAPAGGHSFSPMDLLGGMTPGSLSNVIQSTNGEANNQQEQGEHVDATKDTDPLDKLTGYVAKEGELAAVQAGAPDGLRVAMASSGIVAELAPAGGKSASPMDRLGDMTPGRLSNVIQSTNVEADYQQEQRDHDKLVEQQSAKWVTALFADEPTESAVDATKDMDFLDKLTGYVAKEGEKAKTAAQSGSKLPSFFTENRLNAIARVAETDNVLSEKADGGRLHNAYNQAFDLEPEPGNAAEAGQKWHIELSHDQHATGGQKNVVGHGVIEHRLRPF